MISFREGAEWIQSATGGIGRMVRSMISRRFLDNENSDGDRVRALGRESFDGSYEDDTRGMDQFSPVGVIGRPADDAAVEVVTAFVGGAGHHPVAVTCLDGTRRAVIDAVGLDADETIVYTSTVIVKLLADGTVEIRSIDGTAVELAKKSDADSLNSRVDTVEQALNTFLGQWNTFVAGYPAAPTTATLSMSSATVEGTSVLKAE